MKNRTIRLLLVACYFLIGIFGSVKTVSAQQEKQFPKISIPEIIPQNDKINYLAAHYWDNFNFQDTAFLAHPAVLSKALASYLQVLSMANSEISDASWHHFLERIQASRPMFSYFSAGLKSYLYHPDSPFRNEDYYLAVLNTLIASPKTSWSEKERAKREKQSLLKNKVGTLAADVVYTLASGKTGRISDSLTPYTLLLFYNPGCHACEETLAFLKQSQVINSALSEKELTLIAIYPDEDVSTWRNYCANIRASWINGYDKNTRILKEELFDLRAIPSLYLLDANKTVLLKDAPASVIEVFLNNHKFLNIGY
ncbi:DUF5106 domain-containing protein [Maribellus sp. CM-23]|uniref:DUF5106 domain-containing protein n=1 Tax=Maribellus sp. CM-23 TaxID=2781026 RepID=UPI001F32E74E|nr:DUF5106 domain-containing protein [Maribellus sp. CM-23]